MDTARTDMPAGLDSGDAWSRFVGQLPHWLALQVNRTDAAHDALLMAMAKGWPLERIARECSRDMDDALNVGAVVTARLRALCRQFPTPEQPVARGHQPLAWCGQCDDPRTRWVERPDGKLVRCPVCWTQPL